MGGYLHDELLHPAMVGDLVTVCSATAGEQVGGVDFYHLRTMEAIPVRQVDVGHSSDIHCISNTSCLEGP